MKQPYVCFDRLLVLDEKERIIEIPASVVVNPKVIRTQLTMRVYCCD